MSSDPTLIALTGASPKALADEGAGGKAVGLARLCAAGFDVPEAYVLLGARLGDALPLEGLASDFLAGPLAIRSSSKAEDGAQQSFAGQFESVLGVRGAAAVEAAVRRCLESFQSKRAEAYRARAGDEVTHDVMSVVIQRMVEPTAAGVIFTADPVTGRRDRVVVDAVEGLGEALVSGQANPQHVLLSRDGEVVVEENPPSGPVLDHPMLTHLTVEAVRAAQAFGQPLDLEWAMDDTGAVHWLQARPITTLPDALDEADTVNVDAEHVYTRCNIGEMMPGAVTPLTASVTMRGIDYGIQAMQVAVGVRPEIVDEAVFTAQFSGHLFLNLSAFGPMVRGVAGSNAERLCRAICGRPIQELAIGPPLSAWKRARNGMRYGAYLMGASRHRKALQRDADALQVPETSDGTQLYRWIDEHLPVLFEAYDHHMASSSVAGALVPALLEAISGGKPPSAEDERRCAELLAGSTGESVESFDIAAGMQRLGQAVASDEAALAVLGSRDPEEASSWFQAHDGAVGEAWRDYLERHGHRAVRELELRQAEWAHDPRPLIDNLRLATRAATTSAPPTGEVPAQKAPWIQRTLAKRARKAAVGRERTKSLLVDITRTFKVAYRRLGTLLTEQGRLKDVDDVFFFAHDELAQVLTQPGSWAENAARRREVLAYQTRLRFPEVFQGRGIPIDPAAAVYDTTGPIQGKPVSAGCVVGRARVVRDLSDLATVEEGDILIAPVVDVGWTPCFALIAGLVTEVGSAVSHGCVVAREFGLPAVVGVPAATERIADGQRIELDANTGMIRPVDEAS